MASTNGTNGAGAGYTVTTADLRSHMARLQQIAATLGEAVAAAQQVTLADTAYGHLPDSIAFAGIVRLVSQPGVDALTKAQAAVTSVSQGVGQVAANYDTIEHTNATRLRQIHP